MTYNKAKDLAEVSLEVMTEDELEEFCEEEQLDCDDTDAVIERLTEYYLEEDYDGHD